MRLIENWRVTLAKSYTLWLTYVMLGCSMVIAALTEFGDGLMPESWMGWIMWVLKLSILICTMLQIPARVVQQAKISGAK